jgi:hypothetical protein
MQFRKTNPEEKIRVVLLMLLFARNGLSLNDVLLSGLEL